jgi:hypothetical protein
MSMDARSAALPKKKAAGLAAFEFFVFPFLVQDRFAFAV